MMHSLATDLPGHLHRFGLPQRAVNRSTTILGKEFMPSRFIGTHKRHVTGASLNQSASMGWDTETLRIVAYHYRDDYALLGLQKPKPVLFAKSDMAEQRGRNIVGMIEG